MDHKYWQEPRTQERFIKLYGIRDHRVRDAAILLFAELYVGHNVIAPEFSLEWMPVVRIEADFSKSLAPIFVCRRPDGEEVRVEHHQISVADRIEADPNDTWIDRLSSEKPEVISRMLAFASRKGVYSVKELFDLKGREIKVRCDGYLEEGVIEQFLGTSFDPDPEEDLEGTPIFSVKLRFENACIPECRLSSIQFVQPVLVA